MARNAFNHPQLWEDTNDDMISETNVLSVTAPKAKAVFHDRCPVLLLLFASDA